MTRWMKVRALAFVPACLAAGALTFASCGGDDDGGGGSDEEFLAGLCDSLSTFAEDLDDVVAGAIAGGDEQEAAEDLAGLLRDFADDVDGLGAPDDVDETRDAMVSALKTAADDLESGDEGALENLQLPDIAFDGDTEQRLQSAAEDVEECQALEEQGIPVFG